MKPARAYVEELRDLLKKPARPRELALDYDCEVVFRKRLVVVSAAVAHKEAADQAADSLEARDIRVQDNRDKRRPPVDQTF